MIRRRGMPSLKIVSADKKHVEAIRKRSACFCPGNARDDGILRQTDSLNLTNYLSAKVYWDKKKISEQEATRESKYLPCLVKERETVNIPIICFQLSHTRSIQIFWLKSVHVSFCNFDKSHEFPPLPQPSEYLAKHLLCTYLFDICIHIYALYSAVHVSLIKRFLCDICSISITIYFGLHIAYSCNFPNCANRANDKSGRFNI